MSSKAITEKPESEAAAAEFKLPREWAPSVMAAEEPTLARWFGGFGLVFFLVGIATMVMRQAGGNPRISPTFSGLLFLAGMLGLLYHAASDSDVQIRRAYGFLGFLCLATGLIAAIVTATAVTASTVTLATWTAAGGLALAVPFLLAFIRHEDDPAWRRATLAAFGVVGAVTALLGMVWGTLSATFLLSYGLPLAVLGLIYLWAFIGLQDGTTPLGYRSGLALGALGLVVFAVALTRWLLPTLFKSIVASWDWSTPEQFLSSVGILQMAIGLIYVGVAVSLVTESRFVIMTKRELAAFFYSPLAYFVILWFAAMGALQFGIFVAQLGEGGMREPIIRGMVWNLIAVISLVLVVPLLTMRLFSEEWRSGSMEVLLTAPVTDLAIVLSKFLAVLVVFMIIWVPFGLFLLALRIEGGQPFDYRPIVSFAVALTCSGAGFVAIGLFFSSLTRNQVVAGVLTALVMLVLLMLGLLPISDSEYWLTFVNYVSFIPLWDTALRGRLALKDVAFQISTAVVCIFLTLKVLESRKWR
jgi:ABC-type transport system involved in cytochrome c biogenesis permease component